MYFKFSSLFPLFLLVFFHLTVFSVHCLVSPAQARPVAEVDGLERSALQPAAADLDRPPQRNRFGELEGRRRLRMNDTVDLILPPGYTPPAPRKRPCDAQTDAGRAGPDPPQQRA